MTTTRWIILIVWLLYTVLLIRFCADDYAADCCATGDESAIDSATSEKAINPYPLAFQGNDATPIPGQQIDSLIEAINSGNNDDNALVITGYYYDSEAAPSAAETMGFARAENIRQRFFPDLSAEQVRLRSRRRTGDPPADEPYFEAAGFAWEPPEATVDGTLEVLDDSILTRFPYNSVQQDYDAEVEEYLEKLAERVQKTGERIRLTGHTDNVGSNAYNEDLGMRRAQATRGLLVEKGVPPAQIDLASRGETDPVDTNATEAGRHNNRRVEIRLLKNQ